MEQKKHRFFCSYVNIPYGTARRAIYSYQKGNSDIVFIPAIRLNKFLRIGLLKLADRRLDLRYSRVTWLKRLK